jgi:hypothetical protein
MVDEARAQQRLGPCLEVKEEPRPGESHHEADAGEGQDGGREETENVGVRPSHTAFDDHRGRQRNEEAEDLQEERRGDDVDRDRDQGAPHRSVEDVADPRPEALSGWAGCRARSRRDGHGLEEQGGSGPRLIELLPRHAAPAEARIDDEGAAAAGPLEDHEVIEAPVQDRPRVKGAEIAKLSLNAATTKTEAAARIEDLESRVSAGAAVE